MKAQEALDKVNENTQTDWNNGQGTPYEESLRSHIRGRVSACRELALLLGLVWNEPKLPGINRHS